MAGTWRETARIRDGQTLKPDELGGFRQDAQGNVTLLGPLAPPGLAYSVKLEPTATPKKIDYVIPNNLAATRLGIYELTGDTLRICLARPGSERPTTFGSPSDAGLVLSTYVRQAK
jgi:uncharacterized protein (TIGR03067 family)